MPGMAKIFGLNLQPEAWQCFVCDGYDHSPLLNSIKYNFLDVYIWVQQWPYRPFSTLCTPVFFLPRWPSPTQLAGLESLINLFTNLVSAEVRDKNLNGNFSKKIQNNHKCYLHHATDWGCLLHPPEGGALRYSPVRGCILPHNLSAVPPRSGEVFKLCLKRYKCHIYRQDQPYTLRSVLGVNDSATVHIAMGPTPVQYLSRTIHRPRLNIVAGPPSRLGHLWGTRCVHMGANSTSMTQDTVLWPSLLTVKLYPAVLHHLVHLYSVERRYRWMYLTLLNVREKFVSHGRRHKLFSTSQQARWA